MKIKNTAYFCMLHIYNKRMLFIVSFLIMLVGIVVFFDTFSIYLFSVSDIIKERELLGTARDNLYVVESNYISFDINYYEQYRDFLIRLKKEHNIGIYDVTNDLLTQNFDQKALSEIKESFPDMMKPDAGNELFFPVLRMDNCMLDTVGIKNAAGNDMNLQIEEDGTVEIAVGPELKKWITIGDELVSDMTETKYVVKDILSDDAKWVDGKLLDNVQIFSLGHSIVMPIELKDYSSFECMTFVNNVYLCVDDDFDTEGSIKAIEEEADKDSIYINIRSMKEAERSSLKNNNEEFVFSLLLVVIMMAAVIGIVTILSILGWVADSHDLGILYANGFMNKDIFYIICFENIVKLICAAGISFAWTNVTAQNSLIQASYAGMVYGFIVILFFGVMIISSIISFMMVNRMSPSNLLKGETL